MQKTCKLFLWILLATLSFPVLAQSSPPPISTSATPPNAAAPISAPTRASLTAREIARRSLPSVVMLALETERVDAIKYGSGFFVAPDIIATNFHVVENTLDGYVKVVGQEPIYQILGLVGVDKDHDLALVKVKGIRGTPLPITNSNTLAIGDELFAVGNPKGLEGTFSQGIVSSIRREGKDSVIQITAAISQGSSGGPILNAQGEVIGIAFSALTSGQALNFAIPSAYLKTLIASPKPLLSLLAGSRVKRSRPSEEPSIAAAEDDFPSAEVTPRPRSSSPSMSNESMASNRDATRRKKGFSELNLVVNKTKQETFSNEECKFRMPFDGLAVIDSNKNGMADTLVIEANCPDKNVLLAFTTEKAGRDLTQGVYASAMDPSSTKGNGLPGLGIIRQQPDGKLILCNENSTGRFQLVNVEFEMLNNKFYLNSLQATFDIVCHAAEGAGVQKIQGTLYYNYPQKK